MLFQISFLYANSIPLSSFLSPQDVKHLRIGQRRLIEMLRVFNEICINNSVEYFVIGGTLLGAFAYQGWIPWDCDIDVEILKSYRSKLEKILCLVCLTICGSRLRKQTNIIEFGYLILLWGK